MGSKVLLLSRGGTTSGGLVIAGGPLVEAPVKLPQAVRPWAYLWNDVDSVMLDSRSLPSRNAKKIQHFNSRQPAATPAPVPLRSRGSERDLTARLLANGTPRLQAEAAGRRHRLNTHLSIPSHAERGDYLPPFVSGREYGDGLDGCAHPSPLPLSRDSAARRRPSGT